MARKSGTAQVNSFVGGLITEASPLTFPENATVDEQNFDLNSDGSRSRRKGIDFLTTPVSVGGSAFTTKVITSYTWRNAGGDADKNIIVVQVGDILAFYSNDTFTLLDSFSVSSSNSIKFSYTVVDGILVVATGVGSARFVKYYPATSTFYTNSVPLFIRDLFGVEDVVSGTDLRNGTNITNRPTTLTQAHTYNLRNQTFAVPRMKWMDADLFDPIATFFSEATAYPSNSDSVLAALLARPNSDSDPSSLRFHAKELYKNKLGTSYAPTGYFIIDALARGVSRQTQISKLYTDNPTLSYTVSTLPTDTTPGGAGCVGEYAGRVFYAGFSGELTGGDVHSPNMSSYVLFSKLVSNFTDLGKCYQEGDPTSSEEFDLVDSDGGFIRIEGAFGITGLVNVGSGIAVIANNGVWLITGGDDGFKATSYTVTKLTDSGCVGQGTVVQIDNSFVYWGDSGIMYIGKDQMADMVPQNLSEKSIQKLYNTITETQKLNAFGVYDKYEKKVYWTYTTATGTITLIFDLLLKAFSKYFVGRKTGQALPYIVSSFNRTHVPDSNYPGKLSDVQHMALVYNDGTVQHFRPVAFKRTDYLDWGSTSLSVDSESYLITGYMGAAEAFKKKQAPFVEFYLKKTETGYVDVAGQPVPVNQSSCLVQSQWNWANSANSGKWGQEFEAYRHRRHWIPPSVGSTFDDGNSVVITRNKIRGTGKALSFKIRSSTAKHLELLGWGMVVQTEDD